jgi:[protein-PII] uridylyltransferase
VLFLIEQHLALSGVLTGRDLNDPATARELAGCVGTLENLKLLALMTYADISAVNPEAMTPWRLEQLWSAYLIGNRELTRELQSERIHLEGPDERATFLEGFPTRYLRTHTLGDIEAHMALARRVETDRVAMELVRDGGFWRLTMITADRAGLFAAIAGALASFGMNIMRAEAFANERGFVLDTFAFEDPMRTLELNPMEVGRLERLLKRAALGEEDIPRLLQGRSRPAAASKRPKVEPVAAFDSTASETATLVEIVAQDRPGLLYDLASTFASSGCSIDLVLIDTEAHKAIDVFYVTCNGRKLDDPIQQSLRNKLLACLAA